MCIRDSYKTGLRPAEYGFGRGLGLAGFVLGQRSLRYRQIKIHMQSHDGSKLLPADSCISVTTNGPSTTLQSLCDNMWSRRLCRVVKCKSYETYWILLGRLMTTHVLFEVTVPSTLIVTNWAAERSFIMCEHVNTHWLNDFPALCSVCDYQCRQNCDLKRHICIVISLPSRIQ